MSLWICTYNFALKCRLWYHVLQHFLFVLLLLVELNCCDAILRVNRGAIYVNLGLKPFQRGTNISTNFFHHLVRIFF